MQWLIVQQHQSFGDVVEANAFLEYLIKVAIITNARIANGNSGEITFLPAFNGYRSSIKLGSNAMVQCIFNNGLKYHGRNLYPETGCIDLVVYLQPSVKTMLFKRQPGCNEVYFFFQHH